MNRILSVLLIACLLVIGRAARTNDNDDAEAREAITVEDALGIPTNPDDADG